jgi:hypothetical protein
MSGGASTTNAISASAAFQLVGSAASSGTSGNRHFDFGVLVEVDRFLGLEDAVFVDCLDRRGHTWRVTYFGSSATPLCSPHVRA